MMTLGVTKTQCPASFPLCRWDSKKCVRGPGRACHPPLFLCPLQSLKKPVIPKEFGGKVPTVIRQRYLNLFIEECLKFCSSNQEAIEKVGDPGKWWPVSRGCRAKTWAQGLGPPIGMSRNEWHLIPRR